MIQRIQTLYLMVATLVMVVALIFPIATLNADGNELVIKAFGFSAEGVALPHLPLCGPAYQAMYTASKSSDFLSLNSPTDNSRFFLNQ